MTESDFIQAILADPEAREPYLVFADWLEEQGEGDRATLIRVEDEMAQGRRYPRYDELAQQAYKLRPEVESAWPVSQAWRKVFTLEWKRGLPRTAYLGAPKRWPTAKVRALPEMRSLTTLKTTVVPPPEFVAAFAERTSFRTLFFEGSYRMHRLLQFPKLKRVRVETGVGTAGEPVEEREIDAFRHDMAERGLFVDVDYE